MGRRAAEEGMADSCVVFVEEPGTVQDEATGKFPTTETQIYSGPCEFKAADYQVREIDAASQQLVEQDSTLKLPMLTSSAVGKDMRFRITASQNDPGMVGTEGRIKARFDGSYVTARRFPVEVTS
jgi:hypothetical protein